MIRKLCVSIVAAMATSPCFAEPTYQTGNINDITILGDDVLLKLDSGLPGNCSGTLFGWMIVPNAAKTMKALVLALWARGDMTSTSVRIFTDGVVGSYCQINQIDPM